MWFTLLLKTMLELVVPKIKRLHIKFDQKSMKKIGKRENEGD